MSRKKTAPFGSWRSPITAAMVASQTVRLQEVALAGEAVYWSEGRPQEAGRTAIVCWNPVVGQHDAVHAPFNARSQVHEYGGASFLPTDDGSIYFSNFGDQRIYRQEPEHQPAALTPEGAGRFADLVLDLPRERLLGVLELPGKGAADTVNTLTAVDLKTGQLTTLARGHDFFASPCLNPGGTELAWLSWDHPCMPWDGTELWVAHIGEDGLLQNARRVAGSRTESIFQPQYSPDGTLHCVSDRTGWWNLYRVEDRVLAALRPMEAEFGVPQWVFGMSTYGFASAGRLLCLFAERGCWQLAELNRDGLRPIPLPYTHFENLRVDRERAVFIAASPTLAPAIVALDLETERTEVLRSSSSLELDEGYLSRPQPLEYPTGGGATAHAFFYPPANQDYAAPDEERPILIVKSHGGPTSASTNALALGVQYWTSRGFAVVDVNYGGSTGYGRAYRERLRGRWGVVDVDDCTHAAEYLVERGEADGQRLVIRGGSAGGYTTLAALTFRQVFAAGASHYGVADLEALARDTHKFESRYLDGLVGPYPAERERYLDRSPLFNAKRLSCPVIFFQGLEDRVVPPSQAEAMVESLRTQGVAVAYVTFPEEQHGFRRAENIVRALEAELYFYSRILGFELAEEVEAVEIENL